MIEHTFHKLNYSIFFLYNTGPANHELSESGLNITYLDIFAILPSRYFPNEFPILFFWHFILSAR